MEGNRERSEGNVASGVVTKMVESLFSDKEFGQLDEPHPGYAVGRGVVVVDADVFLQE